MFSQGAQSIHASDHHATLHGVVFDILVGSENRVGLAAVFPEMILRVACRAVARVQRGPPSPDGLWRGSLRYETVAQPDRQRTGGRGVNRRALEKLRYYLVFRFDPRFPPRMARSCFNSGIQYLSFW